MTRDEMKTKDLYLDKRLGWDDWWVRKLCKAKMVDVFQIQKVDKRLE
jgi:hypothetical protein